MGRLSTSTQSVAFLVIFAASLIIGFFVAMAVDVLGLSLGPAQTSLAGAITSVVLVSATLVALYGIPPWRSERPTPDVDIDEFETAAGSTAATDEATETPQSITCPNCGTEFDPSAASVGDRCEACGDGYLTRAGDRVVLDDAE
ncbi:hypothetical protein [Halomicrobium mukohataei]|uniref:Uncharacterized protein n=2 Tax=Halomicrobium mukohataei TaxID=57705 RepID=C7P4Z9_HALMD|nr:hypothetical protein [Halomicrobium mukohataei]ACV49394.1 hypothetical protein Hmuk_3298 [Halomicrobium mukohataei DSM 12286]QCD67221.1 hypothetical protein E5139_16370 [Halomicrobium mukohataei]